MSNSVFTDWPAGTINAGWPQEPSAMLEPGKVEGWPAGTQRAANAAQRLLTQAVGYWDARSYQDGDRFLRNQGTGGDLLDLRLGSDVIANSNDPKFLAPENKGYVYQPGVANNQLSVPSESALNIAYELDVRVLVALDDWYQTNNAAFASKWTTSGNFSWQFRMAGGGNLSTLISTNGTSNTSILGGSIPSGFRPGEPRWIRYAIRRSPEGIATQAYYLSDNGTDWNQLGNSGLYSAGPIFVSTAPIRVGVAAAGAAMFPGKVYRVIILDGGTTVLDIDCDDIPSGAATSFSAKTGQVVTINRESTGGRRAVVVPKNSQPLFLLGTDDYFECQNNWQHGLLNFRQGEPFTTLVVSRLHGFTANAAMIAKSSGGGSSANVGWITRNGDLGLQSAAVMELADGTNLEQNITASRTSGLVNTVVGVRDLDSAYTYSTGLTTVSSPDATKGQSLYNTLPFRIGNASSTTAAYNNMEFFAAAIFRRALSPAEIALLTSAFNYS